MWQAGPSAFYSCNEQLDVAVGRLSGGERARVVHRDG